MSDLPSQARFLDSASLGCRVLVREWEGAGLGTGSPEVLLLHGLGDHSARHAWAAGLLAASGLRPFGFDWPGNGKSDGVRGDMPTMLEAASLLEEVLEHLDLAPEGIFAHSTGAFLALPWLARRGREFPRLGKLRWLWLSSPLLRPSHGQPRSKITLAKALARHFPRLTLSNGVHARDCYHTGFTLSAESGFSREGGHHRVSLRFATSLLESEAGILDGIRSIRPDLAFLLTQGVEDRICPPEYAETLFRQLPGSQKTGIFASGARHEPFREAHHESVTNAVRSWLELRRGIGGGEEKSRKS